MDKDDPNAFQRWISDSVGRFPSVDRFEAVGPFRIGVLEVALGKLSVDDLWGLGADPQLDLDVKPGRYVVSVTGADFAGHRRVAAVQVVHEDATDARLKFRDEGDVLVDSWGVGIGAFRPWYESLTDGERESLSEDMFGEYAKACELHALSAGGKTCRIARCFTGMGSGGYVVESAWHGRKRVGLRCTFIDDEFELPNLG